MQAEIAAWLDRAAADRRLAAQAHGLDLLLVMVCDGQAHGLKLSDTPRRVPAEAAAAGADVLHIVGSSMAFAAVVTSRPEPWFHSFGAWLRHDTGLTITADPLAQAQALAAMERLVEIARPEVPFARFDHPQAPEAVIGRRRCLAGPGGRGCLIHWLEAGQETNMPIIFLHTAGADARQYLYQLGDSCLQRQFRMLAFDMPWHGHSGGEDDAALPEGYRLSEAVYGGWVASFIAQVAEGPVILVGCSMGAAIALAVTAQRPDLTWAFRCQRLAFGHMMVLRLFQDPRSEPECMTRPGSGHDQPHIRSRRRPLGLSARSRIPLAAGWARAEETNLEHGSCQTRVRPGSSTRIRRG